MDGFGQESARASPHISCVAVCYQGKGELEPAASTLLMRMSAQNRVQVSRKELAREHV